MEEVRTQEVFEEAIFQSLLHKLPSSHHLSCHGNITLVTKDVAMVSFISKELPSSTHNNLYVAPPGGEKEKLFNIIEGALVGVCEDRLRGERFKLYASLSVVTDDGTTFVFISHSNPASGKYNQGLTHVYIANRVSGVICKTSIITPKTPKSLTE